LRRHPKTLLDPRQQRGVTLHHRATAVDAPRADAGRNILLERLVEGVALATVEIEHRPVLLHAAERRADHVRRYPRRLRIARDARHEGVEVAAAAGGEGWGGEGERGE